MKTQKGMNLLLIILGSILCIYSFILFYFYFSYHCTAFFTKEVFYGIALHSSMMHRFSQGYFAEMAASTRMIPRIPTLPMEDIAAMGGSSSQGRSRLPQANKLAFVSIRHQHPRFSRRRSIDPFSSQWA